MRWKSYLIPCFLVALLSMGSLAAPGNLAEQKLRANIRAGATTSGIVEVKVHEGTRSLLILAAGSTLANYIVNSIEDPRGNVFRAEIDGERLVSVPYYPGYGTALVLPALDDGVLTPGIWKMRIRSEDKHSEKDPLTIRIVENRASGAKWKTLRLNLIFTGSFGLTTKTYPGSRVERGVAELRQIYSKYGIRVELGTLSDYPLSHQEIAFEPGNGGPSVNELVHLPIARKRGLNVMFVETLDFGAAQGVSPGVPGIFIDHPRAGLVIASNQHDPMLRLKPMGLLLAHEIGHFLGLKHTYEVEEPAPTTSPEIHNIMNPDTFCESTLSDYHLRPDQVRVIREHPLLN